MIFQKWISSFFLCQVEASFIEPVTSASVEQSNSSLCFVKNVCCSTMREDISKDYNTIVDKYA